MKHSLVLLGTLLVLCLPAATGAENATVAPATPLEVTPPEVQAPLEPSLLDPIEMSHNGCHANQTCSGGTISCSAGPTATCTSTATSVTCGSCSIPCSNVAAQAACQQQCDEDYIQCVEDFIPEYICRREGLDCFFACENTYPTHCSG